MIIGNVEYEEVLLVTEDNELIASVTDKDVIEKEGYKIVCVPVNC